MGVQREDKADSVSYKIAMQDTDLKAEASTEDMSSRPAFQFGPSHIPYRILLLGKMIDRVTAQHVRDTGNSLSKATGSGC